MKQNGKNDMTETILEFKKIKEMLREYAVTERAKSQIENLETELSRLRLIKLLRETTEAAQIIRLAGQPPLQDVGEAQKALAVAEKDGLLYPQQLEKLQIFAASSKRLIGYLEKAKEAQISLAYDGEALSELEELRMEINRCIRGGGVDDNATKELSNIRRQTAHTEQQIRTRLEELLKSKKQYCSDSFVSMKNGHYTIPVKKEYKFQVPGVVIAQSATGTTCFIEPSAVTKLNEKISLLKTEETIEEEKVLYTLTAMAHECREEIQNNIAIMERLDFAFAKGKLSIAMEATEPELVIERRIKIVKGRHPLLGKDVCVPVDFAIGDGYRGIVITGPNTGGKTVALKLVGLFSVMAQCGLHLPCDSAAICMNSNVVCDIGDGQNISQNLSTFSAHITNVVKILEQTGPQTLVLLDELGSGTDPGEGMGIAIAILEELRRRNCLFVATTHYSEVKNYAEHSEGLINARMTFDKETLQPQYKLVLGEAGESCAFYVAQRLGFPAHLLEYAKLQTYGRAAVTEYADSVALSDKKEEGLAENFGKAPVFLPKIQKLPRNKGISAHVGGFQMGDSVLVYPEKKVGIVYQPADERGNLIVQVQGEKWRVNHKRLKLKVSAAELYPEDYDFSTVFDTVENRKARHQMDRKYSPGVEIVYRE